MNVIVVLIVAALAAGLGAMLYVIAADKTRYLVRFELSTWSDRYYMRALPNFLQALYDHHFKSPWPWACNAVAATFYKFRMDQVLPRRRSISRRNFICQHLTLFALLEKLRPFINDFVLSEQHRIVAQRVKEMEDTCDRDRLHRFLEAARDQRAAFFKSLTSYDRAILVEIVNRRFIETLRTIHAIFQEHGYSMLSEFDMLRQWESMPGSELVQEIPQLDAAYLNSTATAQFEQDLSATHFNDDEIADNN